MIDGVGGVSMGAFVGAMDASGVDADEMDALLRGVGAASRAAAYTVLRHALIRGARVEAMLGRVFGTVAIEELRRGSFCASADLRSGQFVVSRSARRRTAWGSACACRCLRQPRSGGGGCSSTARSSTTCR